jgi:aminoglycoside phosphotransferase (APT) family kinase protein
MKAGTASGQTSLDLIRSRFLRRIAGDIDTFILPHLDSADAVERATFTGLVLSRFAADGDVVPCALPQFLERFEAEIEASAALLKEEHARDLLNTVRSRQQSVAAEHVFGLRQTLADMTRRLAAIPSDDPRWSSAQRQLDSILALELLWSEARHAISSDDKAAETVPPSVYQRVTSETVTAYLRAQLPNAPDITATSVEVLPGGRSKKTIFISLACAPDLPSDVVMRQDTGMTHMGTVVADEVPILRSLAGGALPVPEILHFEPNPTALGPPFLLMRRLRGKPSGDFTSFADVTPACLAETARALARLHDIDPRSAGLGKGREPPSREDRLRGLITDRWQQWRDDAIEPSPLIDYAFHWLLQRCDGSSGAETIVHGDYGPHNLLAEDGHLTGILDWEFAHLGDPAEDLAYFRPTVVPFMQWPDFMRHYQSAGGRPCDEALLRFYDVWGVLRLAALGAGAVRGFLDGATDDFTQGAGGYFVIPMFERRLAALLRPGA